ncbi:MAG TPA: hypothetical protein VKB92_13355 [Myxococcales bacterium]|nr:hypothetical protein [Myxococcales bacterium]
MTRGKLAGHAVPRQGAAPTPEEGSAPGVKVIYTPLGPAPVPARPADDPFETALLGICAARTAARRLAEDPEQRRAVVRVLLVQAAQELQPEGACAARVIEGVIDALDLSPEAARKPLSDAARDLGKGRGKSQITAPHEVGALAVRIRNCVVASFRRGRSEPRQLAIAIEAGRVQMHGASRIFPNVPADPVDTWERVIRENPRKRTTTLDAGYAETLLEKCSTAAGNPRGSEIFRREEKAEERAEERRSPPK